MRRKKKILFGIIMSLMIIPPVAKEIAVFEDIAEAFDWVAQPLHGAVVYAEKPDYSWDAWIEGSYQTEYDKYLEDHIGLRNFFVRLHNQIDYSLFGRTHAGGVIVGKEEFLYEENYILAYTGKDFLGEDFISEKCQKLKVVQDHLEELGTELVVFFAPGKASFFPEYIPDDYLEDSVGPTNNETYIKYCKQLGIKHIDFNNYFQQIKDTSTYKLYPKCGIHWSAYGSWLALDSICKYVEAVKGIDMVDFKYEVVEVSSEQRSSDYDIGNGLNLFCKIPAYDMPYPYGYSYEAKGKAKPRMMVIADSYFMQIYYKPVTSYLWEELSFRFYNQQVVEHGVEAYPPLDLTYKELLRFDVIMLLYTDANMPKFANGFTDYAYNSLVHNYQIDKIRKVILNSESWMKDIREKAEKRGISVEEMLEMDVRWLLDKKLDRENNEPNNQQ